ncbi:TVP38/TMEM64 family protein [Paenibacillus koleovorans]|uniref:TVP38/TMEM64 family protein n=1 Tax=Paenibacillus koleovorans TaxID=121608 RepID=UPI000FD86DA5|nr:VTT domain-containing protein [Paenibacillus koleovorans]
MNTKKVLSFASILILLLLLLKSDTFSNLISGDPAAIQDLSKGNFWLILSITLLLMAVQNLITLIPVVLLISVNVSIFGFVQGYFWSCATSVIGATITFFISRYWFQTLLHRYVSPRLLARIDARGFWVVFIGRLIPVIPSSIVNITAGMSSVKFKNFLYATLLGNMIYFLVVSLISDQLFS